jgi:hypothetical protein
MEIKELKSLPFAEQLLVIARLIAILLALLILLWLLANQVQDYFYGAELLETPCNLCVELNPELRSCIERTPITIGGDETPIPNVTNLKIYKP